MRQFFRSRWVWLTALLVFTGVLIFASWDRGIAIDYDGTGYLCTVPDDGTAAEVPVSFHGIPPGYIHRQLRHPRRAVMRRPPRPVPRRHR